MFAWKYKYGFIFITKVINGNIVLFFYFSIFFFFQEIYFFKIKFARVFFTGFKYLDKDHLKYSLSSYWVLTNPFIGFLSYLGNWKQKLPSQLASSEITSWYSIIELIFQPDSYLHLSILDESWLCWILSKFINIYIIKF